MERDSQGVHNRHACTACAHMSHVHMYMHSLETRPPGRPQPSRMRAQAARHCLRRPRGSTRQVEVLAQRAACPSARWRTYAWHVHVHVYMVEVLGPAGGLPLSTLAYLCMRTCVHVRAYAMRAHLCMHATHQEFGVPTYACMHARPLSVCWRTGHSLTLTLT